MGIEFSPDQEDRRDLLIDEYNVLLNQGNLDQSPIPFVKELRELKLSKDEEERLEGARMWIHGCDDNKGIGYLSSSSKHDRTQEEKTALFIARCFKERKNPVRPLVLLIDNFYRFMPWRPSLVRKTLTFDEIASEQNPGQDFAIILTGFSDSEIFTQETLEQVPTQKNAGLELFAHTQFGKDLLEFANGQLPLLMKEARGDLKAVLGKIVGTTGWPEEDGKLLLVTGLLLQDGQMWQSLWYEGKRKGTPLYIVAPMSFHDAMNRLNLAWGHGKLDYSYRASSSLGSWNEPPLEDGVKLENYHKQGPSAQEFKRRINPILSQIKSN